MLILNFGLETVHGGTLEPRAVIAAVTGRAGAVVNAGVYQSDTEATLVLIVDDLATTAAYKLAETLAQDCIAVYDPRTKRGRLIGPRAAAWGEFTPEYFVLPTGERLAAPTVCDCDDRFCAHHCNQDEASE